MPRTRPPYSPEFRRQMIDLVRAGRSPDDLAREFEPSGHSIRAWVAQAERNDTKSGQSQPPASSGAVARRDFDRPPTRPAADEEARAMGGQAEAQNQQAASRAQGLPIPSAPQDDRPAEPRRYDGAIRNIQPALTIHVVQFPALLRDRWVVIAGSRSGIGPVAKPTRLTLIGSVPSNGPPCRLYSG